MSADLDSPVRPHGSTSVQNWGKGSSAVVITTLAVLLGLIAAGLLLPLGQTKIYQATATLRIRSAGAGTAMPGGTIGSSSIVGPAEFLSVLAVLSGKPVRDNVATRLSGADLRPFTDPYGAGGASAPPLPEILKENLRVSQRRGTLLIEVQYRHPDPLVAAKVANLFAEEAIAFQARSTAASPGGVPPVAITILDSAAPPPPGAHVAPMTGFHRLMQWLKR
jgi:uncharacterized protein involved in exopolysaccharide biosynthesis